MKGGVRWLARLDVVAAIDLAEAGCLPETASDDDDADDGAPAICGAEPHTNTIPARSFADPAVLRILTPPRSNNASFDL